MNVLVIGSQWGDEGKGKITDLLSKKADVVARYQGGANAGHTIIVDGVKTVLHLIPAGVIQGKACIIGNGVVLNPAQFLKELAEVEEAFGSVKEKLFVSYGAHITLPSHLEEDGAGTQGENKIGTTKRGIGPTYMDKIGRYGIKVGDILDEAQLDERLTTIAPKKNWDEEKIAQVKALLLDFAEKVRPYAADTVALINKYQRDGRNIMLEGAQGTLLDIDHGSYPYVTSSNPTAGGACTGLGIAPKHINHVIGIVKAYTTRVGNGPYPTELNDEVGEKIREVGAEFGATTGRPRRTGWLDAVALRYAAMVNGFDSLTITKLDILNCVDTLKICVGYEVEGKRIEDFPTQPGVLEKCTPIYEEVPSWAEDISQVENYADLPENCKAYLKRIEELSGVPVTIVSVGPQRHQTMVLQEPFGEEVVVTQ